MGCNQSQSRVESIHELVFRGDVSALRKRMEVAPDCVCCVDILTQQTPLHVATIQGHTDIVRLLTSSKYITLDALDDQGRTALYIAAAMGRLEILRLLLPTQEDAINYIVNIPTKQGLTALLIAAINNLIDIFHLLVKVGADISHTDPQGNTCLHHAVMNDSKDCVGILIDRGVDINAINDNGETPLLLAVTHGKTCTCELLLLQGHILFDTPPPSSSSS